MAKTAEQLHDEVEWMAARLTEARQAIGNAPLVVKYLDTNGNERQKTNPAYEAYGSLLRSYMAAVKALAEASDGEATVPDNTVVTLDDISVFVNPLKVVGE